MNANLTFISNHDHARFTAGSLSCSTSKLVTGFRSLIPLSCSYFCSLRAFLFIFIAQSDEESARHRLPSRHYLPNCLRVRFSIKFDTESDGVLDKVLNRHSKP